MPRWTLEGPSRNPRPVRAYENVCKRKSAFSSVNLRDFESILIYFSEAEIVVLQAAIDERKSRRRALHNERPLEPAAKSDYPPSGVEDTFLEAYMQPPS